jgi:hypothetical protein
MLVVSLSIVVIWLGKFGTPERAACCRTRTGRAADRWAS